MDKKSLHLQTEYDIVRLEDYPDAIRTINQILEHKGIVEIKIGKFGVMVSETKRITKYDQRPQ